MFKTFAALVSLLWLTSFLAPVAVGQDYTVEVIDGGPDSESLAADWIALLSDKGIRVNRGTRAAAEIWLAKQWYVDAEFEASSERLYPFTPGQLIGVVHYGRRGSDFREQEISSGWYTLRFGLQPVDGNHVGTSPTRDFLVLVEASKDAVDKQWTADDLNVISAEVAGASHPAMLCLQPVRDSGATPGIWHDEFYDWWIVRAQGKGLGADKQSKDLTVELVVVGHASE